MGSIGSALIRGVPPLVALVGATATGKSALGLALAAALDGEIVNADALQVYRGFDLGTAKPTREEQARVRHHLLDILEPQQRFSAGEFARRAAAAIADIRGRGRLPIVVGGSGFYLRALLEGIAPLPAADPAIRAALRQRLTAAGPEALAAELRSLDPETAARLSPRDTQRVLRALEVVHTTGRPLPRWIAEQPFGRARVAATRVGLTLPRAVLYDRIGVRVRGMRERGLAAEVEGLLASGLDPGLPAFQAIGYRQFARHARGEWTLERAVEETIRATRRFAKRQETWFRKEPGVTWFDARDEEAVRTAVLAHIRRSVSLEDS